MPDFKDFQAVQEMVKDSQDADHDLREHSRDSHLFIDKRDGQWEPYWWNANRGKPRYTFDMTGPVVDQIAGEMELADFDIKVKPAGGPADKAIANTFNGMIRNIQNISNAVHIFNQAGRSMITGGIDGWRVVQRFVDSDSFDQDLMIEPIANFIDRVWFDVASELQDRSDARWGVVLQAITPEEYRERWPDGSEQSVSVDRENQAYFHQGDFIMVAEFYYIEEVERELVLMSNGATYELDDDFEKLKDELLLLGVEEVKRRKRKKNVVFIRSYDANDWLDDAKETVFEFIPIIPTYGNFKIFENKIIYWGVVEKLLDAQRVLNYSMSREIEEGALAPRAKYWMTRKQASGEEAELATMNTNADPVQFFNPDQELPGAPQQQGGAMINPGLQNITQGMVGMIRQTAGLFDASMGANPGLQSGVAIKSLQNKGDTATIKYFKSQEIAICHTARILMKAIPKVYEADRQVRILNEDGSFDMQVLSQTAIDQETQQEVVLNDLSQGTYDVTCSSGPAFKNRQDETVAALMELGQIMPEALQLGADIVAGNINAPGMELLKDRLRLPLMEAGRIPFDQMTDEEQVQAQQQAQNKSQQPDAGVLLAQAEQAKADAQAQKNQIDFQKDQNQFQLDQQKFQLEQAMAEFDAQQQQQKMQLEATQIQISSQQAELKNDTERNKLILQGREAEAKAQESRFKLFQSTQDRTADAIRKVLDNDQVALQNNKLSAETLKLLREAMGVETIVGPHNTEAYINQAVEITENQEAEGFDTDIGETVTGSNTGIDGE